MNGFVPIDQTAGVNMVGECTDEIFKHGKHIETREYHNIVVNSFLILTACMLKNQNGFGGLQYWAVGSGNAAWDTTPVDPTVNETALTNEIGRIPIDPDRITFLDENYEETIVPTNIIKVVTYFGPNDCNGKWREFGLFGGNATQESGSGVMVDKKHHEVITKTDEITIQRTMRFSIQFSA